MSLQIILASQSPRRTEILTSLKVPFTVIPSSFDEESIPYKQNPKEYVGRIAECKAEIISKKHPEALVIAADTVVFMNEHVFGKPPTREDAVDYLTQLCGNWHSVFTGVSLRLGERHEHAAEETRVLFNPLSHAQINAYLDAISWADKSGAYAIQGNGGALLVSQIQGCFYNVMGLPINTLQELLTRFGMDLWHFFAQP